MLLQVILCLLQDADKSLLRHCIVSAWQWGHRHSHGTTCSARIGGLCVSCASVVNNCPSAAVFMQEYVAKHTFPLKDLRHLDVRPLRLGHLLHEAVPARLASHKCFWASPPCMRTTCKTSSSLLFTSAQIPGQCPGAACCSQSGWRPAGLAPHCPCSRSAAVQTCVHGAINVHEPEANMHVCHGSQRACCLSARMSAEQMKLTNPQSPLSLGPTPLPAVWMHRGGVDAMKSVSMRAKWAPFMLRTSCGVTSICESSASRCTSGRSSRG